MRAYSFVRFLFFVVFLSAVTVAHCGDYSRYPEPLSSRADITRASVDTDNIFIAKLSLKDYPALGKFAKLKRVHLLTQEGNGADDQKLLALSGVGLTNLFDIDLLNCPRVTDRGIDSLTRLPALRYLQLEGSPFPMLAARLLP